MYSDKCPKCPQDVDQEKQTTTCAIKINNIVFEYYQEMFLRLLSYFNNHFLWALTNSAPYTDFSNS